MIEKKNSKDIYKLT